MEGESARSQASRISCSFPSPAVCGAGCTCVVFRVHICLLTACQATSKTGGQGTYSRLLFSRFCPCSERQKPQASCNPSQSLHENREAAGFIQTRPVSRGTFRSTFLAPSLLGLRVACERSTLSCGLESSCDSGCCLSLSTPLSFPFSDDSMEFPQPEPPPVAQRLFLDL